MVEWEYARINYAQEAALDGSGMMWTAQITWPGANSLDIRDRVRIEVVLNEVGRDGWELVSALPGPGIYAADFFLKRPKPQAV